MRLRYLPECRGPELQWRGYDVEGPDAGIRRPSGRRWWQCTGSRGWGTPTETEGPATRCVCSQIAVAAPLRWGTQEGDQADAGLAEGALGGAAAVRDAGRPSGRRTGRGRLGWRCNLGGATAVRDADKPRTGRGCPGQCRGGEGTGRGRRRCKVLRRGRWRSRVCNLRKLQNRLGGYGGRAQIVCGGETFFGWCDM
jgi:hypothetical protein